MNRQNEKDIFLESLSFSKLLYPGWWSLAALPSANLSDMQLINMARDEGVVFAMRHALAPGMGDPQNFDVNDCKTQRLLSEEGKIQARMVGEKFRQSGLKSARVKSSRWCRCEERQGSLTSVS